MSSYDFVIAGGGLAGATVCAILKKQGYKILVLEVSPYLGGDCADYKSGKTYVHTKGPHIYHAANTDITAFLSDFTEWVGYRHIVLAEIEDNNRIVTVPFPYSKYTATKLGKGFSPQEVIEKFFKGYSKKMWGTDYDLLPNSIKGRVPKDTKDYPVYYPTHHQCMPKYGFSRMIENMIDGVDVKLSCDPEEWQHINAKHIIYCGRLDHVKNPDTGVLISKELNKTIPYRSIDFIFKLEDGENDIGCLNFCHEQNPYIRKTNYGYFYGDKSSKVVGYELPRKSTFEEYSPHYPIPTEYNIKNHNILKKEVMNKYPNLVPCGRLSGYKYLDMWQVVGNGISICKKQFNAKVDIPDFNIPQEWWDPKGFRDLN